MRGTYLVRDQFFAAANRMRSHFERQFADPLQTHAKRFVWDYWHVPGEYTLLRTPAVHYFPRTLYESFHRQLVRWGRETLGCHDISPPWLSCYVEGCRQEFHRDVPHGPLAFVFSLTNWRHRSFSGGETVLTSPRLTVEPCFNRLLVFNPAQLHKVKRVKGVLDPRLGRLVLHGWFVNPRPFWQGPLTASGVRRVFDSQLSELVATQTLRGQGLVSMRLNISGGGRVSRVQLLADTRMGGANQIDDFLRSLRELRFEKAARASRLTLPLMVGIGDTVG